MAASPIAMVFLCPRIDLTATLIALILFAVSLMHAGIYRMQWSITDRFERERNRSRGALIAISSVPECITPQNLRGLSRHFFPA